MKCISDELVQKYIDGEITDNEQMLISDHLRKCETCVQRVEAQRKLVNQIRTVLESIGDYPAEVPVFRMPARENRAFHYGIRKYIYMASAACLLAFVLFVSPGKKSSPDNEAFRFYSFEGEYDANKTVSQQEMTFYVVDPDGTIIENDCD